MRFWIVSTEAANTSFHEMVKAKIADAVMPGRTSGSTTFWNACSRLQPSVQAASSSSSGMPEKIEKVISTANGIASVVWTSASPICGVVEADADEHHRDRQREQRQREGAGHQHQHAERRLAAELEARQRIAGRRADRDREDHRQHRDQRPSSTAP